MIRLNDKYQKKNRNTSSDYMKKIFKESNMFLSQHQPEKFTKITF